MEKDQTLSAVPAAVPTEQLAEKPAEKAIEKSGVTATTVALPHDSTAAEKPTEPTPKEENSTDVTAPPSTVKAANNGDPDLIEEVKHASGANAQATNTKTQEPVDTRPAYLVNNPALSQFFDRLVSIVETTGHNEMWGVTLKDSSDPPTVNVMMKFLRANEGNVKLAEDQLLKALEWRKKMNPLALAESATFPASKFKDLGYVTTYDDGSNGRKVVFTWNIYGSVKNIEATFGNLEEFINWRVALMELAIRELHLGEATSVMDYNGEDPYQMIQVHDYQNVSFLRMNPNIRAASRQTIEVFSTAYPELLKEKFFVNVPAVMGWVFTALKVFLSKNTIRKFHPITNGSNLAREFNGFAEEIPKVYGGKGAPLADTGRTVTLQEDVVPEAPTEPSKANGNGIPAPHAEPAKNVPVPTDMSDATKDSVQQNDTVAKVPTDVPTETLPN